MAYELPDIHADQLYQACGLQRYDDKGDQNELPAAVVATFEKFIRAFNRIGGSVPAGDTYALIAAFAGAADIQLAADVKRENIAKLFIGKKLNHGDAVVVEWRGESRHAKITGAYADKRHVKVIIDGEDTERRVPEATVSLPVPQEAEL